MPDVDGFPITGDEPYGALVKAFIAAKDALTLTEANDYTDAHAGADPKRFLHLPTYPVSSYGAVGDGSVDDSGAINAAAAAAEAAGGGLVVLDHLTPTYLLDNPVVIPTSVGLIGLASAGPGFYASPVQSGAHFKLNSSTASVIIGDDINGTIHGGTSFCWKVADFDIDGNSTGDPNGALRCDAVNGTDFHNITVKYAGGHGIRIACGQNNTYQSVTAVASGRAVTADDWHLTGGAGGNDFIRCYGGGASGTFVSFTKDTGITNVYTQGPSHNKFDHCIFEVSTPTTHQSAVKYQDAGVNVFEDCLFVGTNPTSGWLFDFPSGGTGGWLNLRDCHYVVTGDVFGYRNAAVVLNVEGISLFQASSGAGNPGNILNTTVAQTRFRMEQPSGIYLISGAKVACSGSGSIANSANTTDKFTGDRFVVSTTEPGNPTVSQIVKDGDTQAKYFQDSTGAMAWGPGGSTFPDKALSRDVDLGMLFGGGLGVSSGRFSRKNSGWTFAGGTTTYTIDASQYPSVGFVFTSGGVPTFAISNPKADQELIIQIAVGSTALGTVTWPSNVNWNGAVPNVGTANSTSTIVLRYDSTFSTWNAMAVPAGQSSAAPFTMASGYWWALVNKPLTTLAGTGLNGLEMAYPFFLDKAQTIKALECEVTVAGASGATVRMGVRADAAGVPGAVEIDGGAVAATSTGMISTTFTATTLKAGWHWATFTFQGSPATFPTVRALSDGDSRYPLVTSSPTANVVILGYYQTGVTDALPSTFTLAGPVSPIVRMFAQAN